MTTFKRYLASTIVVTMLIVGIQPTSATQFSIGRTLTSEELSHLQSHIFADGTGLPVGSGTVQRGREIYNANCAACHGGHGEGANSVELVGDRSLLASKFPDKGIGVYWPYAPTLFDYINRAMPPQAPGSMSITELYSITGYVLFLNDLLPDNANVNAATLKQIEMPNRDGFNDMYPQSQLPHKKP